MGEEVGVFGLEFTVFGFRFSVFGFRTESRFCQIKKKIVRIMLPKDRFSAVSLPLPTENQKPKTENNKPDRVYPKKKRRPSQTGTAHRQEGLVRQET
jgi:hypothetical protein